jgi:hypothetical protein
MPPGGPLPPFGSFEMQAFDADWNAGALTGAPFTVSVWPEPARCEAWICTPPPLLEVGSGKLGTPCERIQLANAIPLDRADADAPEPLELGSDLELPQPAISTAAASAGMVAYRSMAAVIAPARLPHGHTACYRGVTASRACWDRWRVRSTAARAKLGS